MLDWPKSLRVNIPANVSWKGENTLLVRLENAAQDIIGIRKAFHNKIMGIQINGDLSHNPEVLKKLRGARVRVMIVEDLAKIGRNIEYYREMLPIFTVNPDLELFKKINYLTAFGFQVHINMTEPPHNIELLKESLYFYLHHPLLRTPIEPFHTLLRAACSQIAATLWETEYENNKQDIYVCDNGRVTLSQRWETADQVYGNIDTGWSELISSPFYKKIESFKQDLFLQKSDCIFCAAFDLCGGYLRALRDDWPCAGWIEIFKILKDEARNARTLINQQDKGRP